MVGSSIVSGTTWPAVPSPAPAFITNQNKKTGASGPRLFILNPYLSVSGVVLLASVEAAGVAVTPAIDYYTFVFNNTSQSRKGVPMCNRGQTSPAYLTEFKNGLEAAYFGSRQRPWRIAIWHAIINFLQDT